MITKNAVNNFAFNFNPSHTSLVLSSKAFTFSHYSIHKNASLYGSQPFNKLFRHYSFSLISVICIPDVLFHSSKFSIKQKQGATNCTLFLFILYIISRLLIHQLYQVFPMEDQDRFFQSGRMLLFVCRLDVLNQAS